MSRGEGWATLCADALARFLASNDDVTQVQFGYGEPPGPALGRKVFDVLVVGSGASGSVVAAQCAALGLDVLVVERGPHVGNRTLDEIQELCEPAYARDAKGCWNLSGYPWTTCNVGGGTVFYGGVALRARRVDFAAAHHLGDGDLPPDWPYGYDELSEIYHELEHLIGVSGDAQADPLHPDPMHRLPFGAVPMTPAGVLLRDAGDSLGMHGFPTPLAVSQQDRGSRLACQRDAPCMDRACPHGAKGDARTVFLNPALASRKVTLLSGMVVSRVFRRRPDQIDGVEAVHVVDGSVHRLNARCVVLAANAIQSAALLLRSVDEWSTDGIGNEHDMVGRGLSFKLNEYVEAYLGDEVPVSGHDDGAGPFSTVCFMDHYVDSAAPAGLGGLVYENRYSFRPAMLEPQRALRLECLVADQPVRANRVRLSTVTGPIGLPYVVLDYQTHPRDAARLDYVSERMVELLRAAGGQWIRRVSTDFSLGSCHLHGGVRGGADPITSVADPTGRLHEVENVYVADGGFFPFSTGVNPTLTIQAHALRTARIVASTLAADS